MHNRETFIYNLFVDKSQSGIITWLIQRYFCKELGINEIFAEVRVYDTV